MYSRSIDGEDTKCIYNGLALDTGDGWKAEDGCNVCICGSNGKIHCSTNKCCQVCNTVLHIYSCISVSEVHLYDILHLSVVLEVFP